MRTQETRRIKASLLITTVATISTCAVIMIYNFLVTEDSYCNDCPPITQDELDAGWYWGFPNQKKPGTPETWIQVGGDSLSARWVDPDLISDIFNHNGPPITQEELTNGWYYGELNQKKPGTPDNWLHKNEGTRSAMWFDPDLLAREP